jgi:hypothetical protein
MDFILSLGTMFKIELPYQDIDGEIIEKSVENKVDVAIEDDRSISLETLAVDDNDMNLMVVKHLFQRLGVDPDLAESGFDALEKCKLKSYDMIFMDISMPEMNGIETARRIRKECPENKGTIIVAMTAHAMDGDRESFIQQGLDDYISKPFDREKLREIIEKYRNRKKTIREDNTEEVENVLLDRNELSRKFENDMEFIEEMLKMFLNESRDKMDEIILAFERVDYKKVNDTAHYMKGISANLCLKKLTDIFEFIQHLNSADDLNYINEANDCLDSTIMEIRSYLEMEV